MADKLTGFNINSQGYGMIPKMVMQDQGITIAAKALYAYFASFSGAGDTCFPSRKKICFDLSISKDSFTKYLKELTDRGYIKVTQAKGSSGRFSHNIYTLTDTVLPGTEITVAEITGHGEIAPNNNIDIKNNSNNKNNKRDKGDTPFIKPTVDEVRAYCQERKNGIDPERFVDYYTANGWKVGKAKTPMQDWKATVRTWERNNIKDTGTKQQTQQTQQDPKFEEWLNNFMNGKEETK